MIERAIKAEAWDLAIELTTFYSNVCGDPVAVAEELQELVPGSPSAPQTVV